jgi:hypothetical protein
MAGEFGQPLDDRDDDSFDGDSFDGNSFDDVAASGVEIADDDL